jgi:hypothetical protein
MNELNIIASKIKALPGRPPFMIDSDLAMIYGTSTKRINEAVKRNPARFPDDFVFQLTKTEAESCGFDEFFEVADCDLKSTGCSFDENSKVADCDLKKDNRGRHRKYLPYGFTREGCNMLSAVLNTPVAIERSIQIMRAFSAMERGESSAMQAIQGLAEVVKDISDRLKELESRPPVNINIPDDSPLPIAIERRRRYRNTSPIVRNPLVREIVFHLLNEGATYEYVAKVLPTFVPGFKTSRSAIGRFWQKARSGHLKEFGIDVRND